MSEVGPPRITALYVPGDRPDRFDKAVASGADVVIVDLEDAVAADRKDSARVHVAEWLAACSPAVEVQVRINAPATAWGRADLDLLPLGAAVRVPKVEALDDIDAAGERVVHALVESARGVENAFAIATHPRVDSIGLGEADLIADLGIHGEAALSWVRSRIVVAARAAGLTAPMMSVYPDISDSNGLARSCAGGKALGMRGRAAIHPRQLPVIARSFAPTKDQLDWARQVLAAVDSGGVATLPSGAMVDAAMARQARGILGLC